MARGVLSNHRGGSEAMRTPLLAATTVLMIAFADATAADFTSHSDGDRTAYCILVTRHEVFAQNPARKKRHVRRLLGARSAVLRICDRFRHGVWDELDATLFDREGHPLARTLAGVYFDESILEFPATRCIRFYQRVGRGRSLPYSLCAAK
jgi:hypothetical protein